MLTAFTFLLAIAALVALGLVAADASRNTFVMGGYALAAIAVTLLGGMALGNALQQAIDGLRMFSGA